MVNDWLDSFSNSLDFCVAVVADYFDDGDLVVNEKNLIKVLEEGVYEFISETLIGNDKEVPTIDQIIKHYLADK